MYYCENGKLTRAFSICAGQPEGASQRIDFSCNKEIVAYYPHVKLGSYPHPFIAANVDDLDPVSSA